MKVAAIGDEKFINGFRLAGAEAVNVKPGSAEGIIRDAIEREDLGIIVLRQELLESLPAALAERVTGNEKPVVVIIGEGYLGPLRDKTKKILGIDIYGEMSGPEEA